VVDEHLIMVKAGAVQAHLRRARSKCPADPAAFAADHDLQDIVLFNLQMAIQNCADIAAHICSEEGFGVPGSVSELLYLLEENGVIDRHLTEKMVKAVGLRNLIVHTYARLDFDQVHAAVQNDLTDLTLFLEVILTKYQRTR
jgi:uncharacterized protein YutE (UPF0331/DUF86 family)